MKSIRHILIAILLGLLLALGSRQVAHAPHYEPDSSSDKEQSLTVVSRNTPRPVDSNHFVGQVTTVPETLGEKLDIPTAAPSTETYSCSTDPVGNGAFVWPTDNHALSGNDYGPSHPGIDLAAGEGSSVYAADAGVVIAEGDDPAGYGNIIQIDHGNGYLTVYAHLSVIEVRICQSVEAGQQIGTAGSTGNASGAHLHFEVAQDGMYINPWEVLP